jgi:hypothetical protein
MISELVWPTLLPVLNDDEFRRLFDDALATMDSFTSLLRPFGPRLDHDGLDRALHATLTVNGPHHMGFALEWLKPLLDARQLTHAATQVAAVLGSGPASRFDDRPVRVLADVFTSEQRDIILTAATEAPDHHAAQAVVALAPHLDGGQPGRALACVMEIEDNGWRATARTHLAPTLTHGQLATVVDTARQMDDPAARATTIVAVLGHLPAAERTAMFGVALAAATRVPDPFDRANGLIDVAAVLPAPERNQPLLFALDLALDLDSSSAQSVTLTHLLETLVKAPTHGRGSKPLTNRGQAGTSGRGKCI